MISPRKPVVLAALSCAVLPSRNPSNRTPILNALKTNPSFLSASQAEARALTRAQELQAKLGPVFRDLVRRRSRKRGVR